ncbi:MAG: YihA family ribosome biogenesis GTP-binding protein, partial [Bacteroidales bacterium]|nr:YihA family ribosome biogenesis GTP-binding protein [Bacteroidales bacterium]
DFMSSLIESGLAFSIIFTKSDKLKQRELNKNISNYKAKLLEIWESLPPIFISSSFKKEGGEEILAYISDLNEKIKL